MGSIVIRLAREDLVGAIELLQQHDSRELVRQRDRPERELGVTPLEREPVWTADDKAQIEARLAALLEPSRQLLGGELAPAAIEQYDVCALGNPTRHLRVVAQLDQLQAGVAAQQLLVVLHVVHERRPEPPDSEDQNPHEVLRY